MHPFDTINQKNIQPTLADQSFSLMLTEYRSCTDNMINT